MTTHTTQFSVYKIESFAVPSDTTRSQNNDGYTVIQNLPHIFALSPDEQTYIELTATQLPLCEQDRLIQCMLIFPRQHTPTYTCAAALYFDSPAIKSLCEFKLFPNKPLKNAIIPTGSGAFLISTNSEYYRLDCPGKPIQHYPACPLCQVKVQCGCGLTVDSFEVPPTLENCDEIISTVVTLHTVNYALLLQFDTTPIYSLNFTPKTNKFRTSQHHCHNQ